MDWNGLNRISVALTERNFRSMAREASIKTLLEFLSCPLNSEDEVFSRFESLPGAVIGGEGLSKWCYVPGTRPDKVLLVAHADTVWHGLDDPQQKLNISNRIVTGVKKDYGIGADDRAGCAIVYLMKDSGHSLLIVNGEERGCIGSREAVKTVPIKDHQFAVQFDRRGGTDFKCYDVGTTAFRKFIKKTIGYTEPNRFSTTDIRVLCREICGVNLSVGYSHEHSSLESLNLNEWYATFLIAVEMLKGYCPKFKLDKPKVEVKNLIEYNLDRYYGAEDDYSRIPYGCYICNKPVETPTQWLCNSCTKRHAHAPYV